MANQFASPLRIGRCEINSGFPTFLIAEAGVNHNGDPEIAKQLVEVAAAAGADAVKFQTFRAEELASFDAPKAEYQKRTTEQAESQLEMLKRLEISAETHRELSDFAKQRNIIFLSSPFDAESVDLLTRLGVPAFKIPSGEITNWPFLEYVAGKEKPIIMSTGMSDLTEVKQAVAVLRGAGCRELALLHCTSNYPAGAATSNLRAMETLREEFGVPVGLSDHTLGTEVAIAAVALGARILEKHFTLDRTLPGPDHAASLDPDELHAMVKAIRNVEAALCDGCKRPTAEEMEVRHVARRSILTRQSLPAGTRIAKEMLDFKRPGSGIPPSDLARLIGKTTIRDLHAGAQLRFEDVA